MAEVLTVEQVSGLMAEFGPALVVRKNRIRIITHPQKVLSAIKAAQQLLGCDHLISISCYDTGESFCLVYHLTGPHATVLSLEICVPQKAPQAFTVSDILPPAGIYERQIHDLFGIVFLGHPGLARLMLNEDWPPDEHPLRKDWKPQEGSSYGGTPYEVT